MKTSPPAPLQAVKSPPTDPLAVERRAFERQRAQLMKRYLGQHVAFYGGRFVDHDEDCEALAARLFARLGDVPFYIARVEKKPTLYDLPSPEIHR
jgi:predicted Zn-dependent protease